MKQIITSGIVLARTNYQEADRILTLLTPDNGKVKVLAKGVRKSKSRLAGGVELFSVSEIGFVQGRGELCTLTSARLKTHYGRIVQNIDRTILGYDLIRLLNKVTEDEPEQEYFHLLLDCFESLDNPVPNIDLVRLWFYAQLLRQAGHSPNLHTDALGNELVKSEKYVFGYDDMNFNANPTGNFTSDDIKFLRLVFGSNKPITLQKIQGIEKLITGSLQLIQTILPSHIRT